MRNELIWIIFALCSFFALYGARALFGILGLYVWIVLMIIVSNIAVVMTVSLFGFTVTLGNIFYGSTFAATDSLCELKGKRAARQAVWVGFYTQCCFTAIVFALLLFAPDENDFAYPHLSALFKFLPRITLASLTAYLISQLYDIWAFERIRALFPKRNRLWVRNNFSTISSQAIDSGIFCAIAFIGVFPIAVVGEIFLTTYIIKILVALLDTPFVYLLTRRTHRDDMLFRYLSTSLS